jgi:methylamine---glutamate N-methyltransferase subunit C
MAKYICDTCGFIFNEEKEKMKFNDLEDDWKCPHCGVPKKEFRKLE